MCCPRDCVSRHNGGTAGAPLKPLRDDGGFKGGTRGSPIMPRDAVSRTAHVGTVGVIYRLHCWNWKYCHQNLVTVLHQKEFPNFTLCGIYENQIALKSLKKCSSLIQVRLRFLKEWPDRNAFWQLLLCISLKKWDYKNKLRYKKEHKMQTILKLLTRFLKSLTERSNHEFYWNRRNFCHFWNCPTFLD